ncbi:MAG: molecular chaperone HtpG [Bacteroidetes bacterium]|nr:molecular chaperone HtpG [Bacteroidota bacterium]
MERGNISVSTENIFPIIKKSLYSDQEIFLRELVANAIDATQKLKHLSSIGEFSGELGELKVKIALNKEAKTLTISDSGLGMTDEEVKKYLNQVAFSGAEEFLKKFKDAGNKDEIIGKFGLGFYSAFMVASEVEVISKSYQEDTEAIRWTCDGTTSYTLGAGTRETRGTDVILHIAEDAEEYLEEARIRNILNKYGKFLPIEIEFEGEVINNPNPIWKKAPTELTDEDYKEFFKELYPFSDEPLFWIHLNVDYPFNLTGILYFPKIRQDIDPRKNNIQLYSRQVFITDEVDQIVPDYLMLLQGVIDSPDIPLNVSRSYLQSDSNVRKISSYITRKVADKLHEIYKEDRGKFEEKWRDISIFVKYGMMTDDKFYEKAEKFCLLENVDGNFFTLTDYKEKVAANQTDKDENVIYLYTTDKKNQDMFIRAAEKKSYDVLNMNGVIDSHFIGLLERKFEKTKWARVDSDTVDKLIVKAEEAKVEEVEATEGEDGKKKTKKKKPAELVLTEEQENKLKETFTKVITREGMHVQVDKLGKDQLPILLTRPEFMRRMKEMAAMGGGGMAYMGEMPETINVVVNTQHPLVQNIIDQEDGSELAKQLYDLALLSQNLLEGKDLTDFIHRSVEMLQKG